MWEVTYYGLLRPLALGGIWTEGKSPTFKFYNPRFPSHSTAGLVGADQHKALAQGFRNLAQNNNICCRILSRIMTHSKDLKNLHQGAKVEAVVAQHLTETRYIGFPFSFILCSLLFAVHWVFFGAIILCSFNGGAVCSSHCVFEKVSTVTPLVCAVLIAKWS